MQDKILLSEILRIIAPSNGSFANLGCLAHLIGRASSKFALLQGAHVAYDKERTFRPREAYVQPTTVREEADMARWIIPDSGEDNDVFFSAFEAIDGLDLYVRDLDRSIVAKYIGKMSPCIRVPDKKTRNEIDLRFVWRYDTNIFSK